MYVTSETNHYKTKLRRTMDSYRFFVIFVNYDKTQLVHVLDQLCTYYFLRSGSGYVILRNETITSKISHTSTNIDF